MRVLLISPYPPQRDGIGDYAASLVRALVGDGHEVAVITPTASAGSPPEVLGALGTPGVEARAAAFAPDVVHLQFAVAAFGARALGLPRLLHRLRGTTAARIVVTAHEATRDTALLRAPGRALYRRVSAAADLVITHTPGARAALTGPIGVPRSAVRLIAHPRRPPPEPTTDAAALRAAHGLGDDRVLLAFGFVHVDKGLDDLVRAMGLLARRDPHALDGVRLVVAGDVRRRRGPLRAFEARDRLHLARVRRAASALPPKGRLIVTGYVPSGEVAPWFDAATAVVLPYRRIEQSGVGSLAAAAGVPVLTTTAGSLAEDFGDPRWTAAPGDIDGLASALGRLLAAEHPPAATRVEAGDLEVALAATLEAYGAAPPPTVAGVRP